MTLSSETSAMGNIDPFVLKKVNREYLFKLPYMNHRNKLFLTMDKNGVSYYICILYIDSLPKTFFYIENNE